MTTAPNVHTIIENMGKLYLIPILGRRTEILRLGFRGKEWWRDRLGVWFEVLKMGGGVKNLYSLWVKLYSWTVAHEQVLVNCLG